MVHLTGQTRKGRITKAKTKSHKAAKRMSRLATAFELVDDPIRAFKDVTLPKGTSVVLVPETERAEEALRKLGSVRIKQLKEFYKRGRHAYERQVQIVRPKRGPQVGAKPIAASAYEPDARARAILRGRRIVEEDLRQSGGAYELDDVRMLLHGISRQMVDRKVKDGTLLAVTGPSNRRVYPTVQFNRDGSVVAGLKAVREALPTENPWAVLNFLVRPDVRLGERMPIDLLREGEVDIVVEAARRMGQQGA